MNESDYIPIAALNQHAYCPHRCWRMFCAGGFVDNQYTFQQGFVYYTHSHQRQAVVLTSALRDQTIATIASVRALIHTGKMPLPVYTKRCQGCSLYAQCLPRAAKKLGRYQEAN